MIADDSDSKDQDKEDDWLLEKQEWLHSLADVHQIQGDRRVRELLRSLQNHALQAGVKLEESTLNTPYCNTITRLEQPTYPGNIDLERRIENIIRWNAMAMVLKANDSGSGVGGHIGTYGSAATMLEVGLNHFFRNADDKYGGDIVNVQPHSAPGMYARAYLEDRLSESHLDNYRRELEPPGGLSSYPHPRRMPGFWPCPTASMGLSTVTSIYLARYAKYLEHRGLKPRNGGKVWCFIGDGETDEPEVLGTINIAAREKLDNLILVVNCNLQRLDGPVRGNGKIIQELESIFRGSHWDVIKVIWGSAWDELFACDVNGALQQRMETAVDGDYQMYSVLPGEEVRAHWVQGNPELADLMKTLSDEEIRSIRRGGHDRKKVFAAYDRAVKMTGKPVVILVKTIKGYGMGESGEGQNIVHQKKQMSDEERSQCARRFEIPLNDEQIKAAEFYHPGEESDEVRYLLDKRSALGGFQPIRDASCPVLPTPDIELFSDAIKGTERKVSTTMSLVRLLSKLLRHKEIGKYIVPIVPDEARTFGMDGLFRQVGIYSSEGQQYRPVDADSLTAYHESESGQILQEGICEAGAMASFLAAGTAYAHFGVPSIPFYFFYSMFGFQRVGDMIWACGDSMCRGFLIGGTAGRTTLNGEGLQHADGHSHVLANTVPNLLSYDPAFAYELAVIVRDGIRRMYTEQEDVFYYLSVYNENYAHPTMPKGAEQGILRGIYKLEPADETPANDEPVRIHLLGSGSIMQQVLGARDILADKGIVADIWSVTSYNLLYRDAVDCEDWNRRNPGETPRVPFIAATLAGSSGLFVAASDFMKVLPASIATWIPGTLVCLGTDGFGLSESRESLREHFGISSEQIAQAVLDGIT
jgi:pyruvate dehydrogenase E1 component